MMFPRATMTSMPLPDRSEKAARNRVLRAETIGILIVAIIGFVIVLIRYGRYLDWHAR
jgi:hypothetical protein